MTFDWRKSLIFAAALTWAPPALATEAPAPAEAEGREIPPGAIDLSDPLVRAEYERAWSDVYRLNTNVAYVGLAMPVIAIGTTFGTLAVVSGNCREFGCVLVPMMVGGLTVSAGPLVMGIGSLRAGTALWALGRPVDRIPAIVAIASVPLFFGSGIVFQSGAVAMIGVPVGYAAGIVQLVVNSGAWREPAPVAIAPWVGDDVRGVRLGFAF